MADMDDTPKVKFELPEARNFLVLAERTLQARGVTYDKGATGEPKERSMPAVVAAFNAITGHELTAEQGWLFMVVLKATRSQQGEYRADNFVDGAAYFGLAGEQAAKDAADAPERG